MNDIDMKKLLEQDDEFREFMKESLCRMFTTDPSAHDLVSALFGFYQIGLTPEQVQQWHMNNVRMRKKE